ncbi:hypothetical protein NKY71_25285 [Sinorhizobium meliloti]|uniref:hypothetical protein n=1 Tax=Rhizobium meliloti TaxID=382 RepID=UPI003D6603CD
MSPKLNSISAVKATAEAGVFLVYCNITDIDGDTYDAEYGSRPEDTFGLNPTIRQWLVDNPGFPIQPYTPPTAEELRQHMPSLTARQLRLCLVNNGYSMSQVSAVIEAMPEGADKETARIEWEYATTFERTHPLITTVGAALSISEEQTDSMWTEAKSL